MDKIKGVYCPHIEAKMPRDTRQSIKARPTNRIEDYWLRVEFPDPDLTAKELLRKLRDFGLDVYERKLVYYTAVMGLPLEETSERMGWLNKNSASYYYKRALKKLREGKFKLK